MKIVKVSPLNLFQEVVGGLGGVGVVQFLEENLAFQNITKHHTKFQPSSSKRLKIIPYINLGTHTDDTRHMTLTLEEL